MRIRRIRTVLLIGALAANLFAGPVYFSAHGKTYHGERSCSLLARSHEVLTADESAAAAHGLHKCARCYGDHKSAGKSNATWATKVN